MQVTIEPGNISGTMTAPASKSMMQRACAGALLHNGTTVISNPGASNDDLAALDIIAQLGATIISKTDTAITISGNGLHPINCAIDCGESGLCARLFTPIAALGREEITITGSGSLLNRPMDLFKSVLPALGVKVEDNAGYLPVKVHGPMHATNITVDGSAGSQFITGLLFALSHCATKLVTIKVINAVSKPYLALTLQVLEQFGKPVKHENHDVFYIDPTQFQPVSEVHINVEGDWSSAAFMLAAGAIAGSVTIDHLDINSAQADIAIVDVLRQCGAEVMVEMDSVTVKRNRLDAFEFDATDCPDLFPVLAVLAACCRGESYIKGVHRLLHKESNRVESISEMLQQFGADVSFEDDTMSITGSSKLDYCCIDSYNDHRIAMAAAVGALRAKEKVKITGAEAVNKSYPGFYEDLMRLGVSCIFVEP